MLSVFKKVLSKLRVGAYTIAMESETSYCELRRREVINGSDGRRMGHVLDLVFNATTGKINGIILPYGKRGVFGKSQDLFVPWQCVQKIGEDVIIVEINDLSGTPVCVPAKPDKPMPKPLPPSPPPPPPRGSRDAKPECDGKCEKCMLFDCSRRWEAGSAV